MGTVSPGAARHAALDRHPGSAGSRRSTANAAACSFLALPERGSSVFDCTIAAEPNSNQISRSFRRDPVSQDARSSRWALRAIFPSRSGLDEWAGTRFSGLLGGQRHARRCPARRTAEHRITPSPRRAEQAVHPRPEHRLPHSPEAGTPASASRQKRVSRCQSWPGLRSSTRGAGPTSALTGPPPYRLLDQNEAAYFCLGAAAPWKTSAVGFKPGSRREACRYEVCAKLGYCGDTGRWSNESDFEGETPDEVVDAVFVLEGLDPATADPRQRAQIRVGRTLWTASLTRPTLLLSPDTGSQRRLPLMPRSGSDSGSI
jgi:hypothetical protein